MLDRRSAPMVDAPPLVGVAEQKLPKPCVGYTATWSGSSAARRRTERYWARVSASVSAGPIRSVRPDRAEQQGAAGEDGDRRAVAVARAT